MTTNTTVNDSEEQLEPAGLDDHLYWSNDVLDHLPASGAELSNTAHRLQAAAVHAQLAQVAALQQIFTALTELTIAVKRFGA